MHRVWDREIPSSTIDEFHVARLALDVRRVQLDERHWLWVPLDVHGCEVVDRRCDQRNIK